MGKPRILPDLTSRDRRTGAAYTKEELEEMANANKRDAGRNIVYERNGDIVTLTIDVSAKAIKAAPVSSSGKSKVIASTNGNIDLDGVKYGINVYQKA